MKYKYLFPGMIRQIFPLLTCKPSRNYHFSIVRLSVHDFKRIYDPSSHSYNQSTIHFINSRIDSPIPYEYSIQITYVPGSASSHHLPSHPTTAIRPNHLISHHGTFHHHKSTIMNRWIFFQHTLFLTNPTRPVVHGTGNQESRIVSRSCEPRFIYVGTRWFVNWYSLVLTLLYLINWGGHTEYRGGDDKVVRSMIDQLIDRIWARYRICLTRTSSNWLCFVNLPTFVVIQGEGDVFVTNTSCFAGRDGVGTCLVNKTIAMEEGISIHRLVLFQLGLVLCLPSLIFSETWNWMIVKRFWDIMHRSGCFIWETCGYLKKLFRGYDM